MSADNGIYIAKFPDGYRVCCASSIENIDFYQEGTQKRRDVLKGYFGNSDLYKTEDDAWQAARDIHKNTVTEYGVKYIGELESFNYYTNTQVVSAHTRVTLLEFSVDNKRLSWYLDDSQDLKVENTFSSSDDPALKALIDSFSESLSRIVVPSIKKALNAN